MLFRSRSRSPVHRRPRVGSLTLGASVLAIAACANVALAQDEEADEQLVAETVGHSDAIPLEILRSGDVYVVVAPCAGCLVDLRVEDWLAADSPRHRRARRDVTQDVVVAEDGPVHDEATLRLADERPGYAAFDVVALVLVPETTTAAEHVVEVTRSVFARITDDGAFPPGTRC